MKKRYLLWIVYLAIGVGIGKALTHYGFLTDVNGGVGIEISDAEGIASIIKPSRSYDNEDAPKDEDGSVKSTLGGDFTLIDHNGNEVTQDDYADTYKLYFFGFTFCPAVCPTELQKVALVMEELDAETAAKITPIFVTVDPERDTADVMKQYVEQFHPKLVGLTGSQEQITDISQKFRIYAKKVENEMMEGYMMDHSSYLYLMDKDNNLAAIYPATDTAEDIVADLQKKSF